MMKKSVVNLLLAGLCFGLSSCRTSSEPLNVQIPAGLVEATHSQKKFVANLKTLSRGMSLQDAKKHLGPPSEETKTTLFYNLIENRVEGGFYVNATLSFVDSGLTNVSIGFGHKTRSLKIE